MKDNECVRLLQWALPQLGMRWQGFRRVRKQVCKRIARRLKQLQLSDGLVYQAYLQTHAEEWAVLDGLCYVTVTRFYRDKLVFARLEQQLMPELAQRALDSGMDRLRVWSLGCGSGEEPYTLAILWCQVLQARFPALQLGIIATDVEPVLLERAQQACYPGVTVKNLPEAWRSAAFRHQDDNYCLYSEYRSLVHFMQQDIREQSAQGPFDLILCRNLVFTYYDVDLQRRLLEEMNSVLRPGGVLVIGVHERLPPGVSGLGVVSERLGLYRRHSHSHNQNG